MSAYAEPRACGKCGSVQFQALVDVTTFDTPPEKIPELMRGRWEACQYCGSTAEPVDPPEDPFLQKT